MTGTFKANNPYNSFLLLLYGLLLKIPMFLNPAVPEQQKIDGFLYKALLQWLHPFGTGLPVIYGIISFLLLYTQAITFNNLVSEQRLFPRSNYLTGMSYLLITSLFKEWNILSSPLIINTLLLWVWARMSNLHNTANVKTTLFNIGIAIGISTFFYFPAIAFAALIVFGLIITRPFRISEWLISLFGIITPYYFLLAIVFLTGSWKGYRFPGISVTAPKFNQTGWAMAAIIIVLFATVIGFFLMQKNLRRQLLQTRKSWNLVLLYLLVAVFIPFINDTHTFEYWILCAVPVSAFTACTFFYPERRWFPQALHWIMAAFVIAINYFVR
ncbi:MAG: DUF6427 family protein [Ferruginibacter sp.]